MQKAIDWHQLFSSFPAESPDRKWGSTQNRVPISVKLQPGTLGCPDWTLSEILTRVKAYGYDGVELRGLGPDLDLVQSPHFSSRVLPRQSTHSLTRAWKSVPWTRPPLSPTRKKLLLDTRKRAPRLTSPQNWVHRLFVFSAGVFSKTAPVTLR